MQTVSMLLNELTRKANERKPGARGTLALRELISKAAKRKETYSQPAISLWRTRGIPWPLHTAMDSVCVQLGVKPDRRVYRNIRNQKVAA